MRNLSYSNHTCKFISAPCVLLFFNFFFFQKNHCSNRSVKCEYCEIDLPFAKIQEHKDFCGSRTELCSLCKRYIQLKDLDVHVAMKCEYPEVQPKPATTRLSHVDHSDGLQSILSPGCQDMWPDEMHFLMGGNTHRTPTSHMFPPHLISPTRVVWNPQVGNPVAGDRRRTSGTADRKHRKNQDRVQNSFGVTGKKKGPTSSSNASRLSRPWEKNGKIRCTLSLPLS